MGYEELRFQNLTDAITNYTDYNPDGSFSSKGVLEARDYRGSWRVFKGYRKTPRLPKSYPPPLRPVTIGSLNIDSPSIDFSVGNHPTWGKRVWSGEFAALCAKKLNDSLWEIIIPGSDEMDPILRDTSLQKAWSNIEKPDFNGQLFLAELAETISMLINPFAGMQKVYSKFKKARKLLKESMALPNLTADMYLQYMFGIAPLISDVQGIYEAYMKVATERNELYARSSTRNMVENDHIWTIEDPNVTKIHQVVGYKKVTAKVKTTSKIYYKMSHAYATRELHDKWGFNPLTLPVTLWEKVPLSFVVDWFLGIKLWLSAMTPKPGIDILGNTTSEKLIEQVLVRPIVGRMTIPSSPVTTYTVTYDDKPWVKTYERLIRQVNLPIPNVPQWGCGIDSLGKAISSAALSVQKLKL